MAYGVFRVLESFVLAKCASPRKWGPLISLVLHFLLAGAFQLTGFRNWEAINCLEWMPLTHSLTHGGCGLLLRCVVATAAAAEHLLLPTQRRRRRPPSRPSCGWNLCGRSVPSNDVNAVLQQFNIPSKNAHLVFN